MKINAVKEKLKNNHLSVGALLPFYSPAIIETLGYAGCDFVTFDSEHGPLTISEIENMTRAANCAGIIPFTRVVSNNQSVILRVLDTGVMGVQIPHICSPDDAVAAVHGVKYYPYGNRGLAGSVRAAKYSSISSAKYIKHSNENTLVIIQIEDIKAIPHLEKILSIEGIDVVFLGRNDLAHSMGFTGQSNHPDVEKIVDQICSMTLEKGLTIGVSTNVENSSKWIERGARFISLSVVPIILKSWKAMIEVIRSHTNE